MKLFLCPMCEDIVRMVENEMRYCQCGKSGGMYRDKVMAEIEGHAIPIGISNPSLVKAVKLQQGYDHSIRIVAFTIPSKEKNHIIKQPMCNSCRQQTFKNLDPIEHSENMSDTSYSALRSQGYRVYKCNICGEYWGCRYQWDPGSGSDNRWKAFGKNPENVRRHY